MVVGPHDEPHILDRDDDGERPEEQGKNTEYVFGVDGHLPTGEHFFEGVQDAGSDVAVHNTDRAQSERRERRFRC